MHRSSWWRSASALVLALGLFAPACSGSDDDDNSGGDPYTSGNLSPAQLCSNVAADQCDKIYSCASPEQLRSLGFPATKTDCIGDAIDQLRCTSATASNVCGGSAINGQQVAACSSQVKAASCDQVVKASNVGEYANNCGPCAFHR